MKRKWLLKAFGCLAALVCLDILYDTTHFVVKRYELKSTKIKSPYHFVVLSDLHDKAFGYQNKNEEEKLLKFTENCLTQLIKSNRKRFILPGI